jgi:hypothetical protein
MLENIRLQPDLHPECKTWAEIKKGITGKSSTNLRSSVTSAVQSAVQ